MKSLSDYTKDGQTKAFETHGAFFAFSNEQLNKSRVEGVEYVNGGGGLICPKANYKQFSIDLEIVHTEAIKQDVEENGLEAIIKRELSNYECYYTGEIDDAVDALKIYDGITAELVQEVYSSVRRAS